MTKYLRFMRHGATELNVADCWQGHADSPLTELGRRQAAETGEHIRQAGIEFDAILCSPLGRVIQTLECALPERAAQGFETSEGIIEMYFGSLDGKKHVDGHPSSPYHDQFLAYGGEAEDEVERRVCAALDELMSRPDVLTWDHRPHLPQPLGRAGPRRGAAPPGQLQPVHLRVRRGRPHVLARGHLRARQRHQPRGLQALTGGGVVFLPRDATRARRNRRFQPREGRGCEEVPGPSSA